MKILKALTRWIWKKEIEQLEKKIEVAMAETPPYVAGSLARHDVESIYKLVTAHKNLKDEIRRIAQGTSLQTVLNITLRKY